MTGDGGPVSGQVEREAAAGRVLGPRGGDVEQLGHCLKPTHDSAKVQTQALRADGQNCRMPAPELISRHPDDWRRAVTHPFLDGIRDGTLAEPTFDTWLEQDYIFVGDLLAFQARLLADASRRAQRPLAAGLVALEAELTWFEQCARARGLVLGGRRHPTTEAYLAALSRLLSAGEEPALTALWTLERAYLEAWLRVAPGAPRYRDFVEHWTVPEFARYVGDLQALAVASPQSEAAFLEICALERAFWEMSWTA